MGNSTSSRAKATSATAEAAIGGKISSSNNRKSPFGARGRKVTSSAPKQNNSNSRDLPEPQLLTEEPVLVSRGIDITTEESDDTPYETDEEFSDDDEDEEFDEYLAERMRILADAAALKRLAVAFLHPELPVVTTDPTACARCFFDRYSAPERLSYDEAEEQARILEDSKLLKDCAVMYAHPELPVVTSDPTATARNYYERASAPEQLSYEEAEEQAHILADAKALEERAVMYAHPELPVVVTDPAVTARDYFYRASAPEQLSYEESEEQARILADAKALEERAVMYAHPELPVVTSDPTATARNYYERASAPEQLSYEEAEEQAHILADAKALEERAVMYAHPELPVEVSSIATARCYFQRASAPEQESLEEMEERAQVLADAADLKKMAVLYAHPELPVEVSAVATARCYFDRASAPYDAEQIISTSAYCAKLEEEKEAKSLEQQMERLEALAPAATKVKTVPAAGPEAAAAIPRSASQVHLFDLQDAA